jgi:cold shock protein
VHQNEIDKEGFRSLDEGMKVTYEEESGDKGPKAVRVKPV